MTNFGPLTAEIGLPVWGTAPKFNWSRVLASLLHRHRSTEVNQTVWCLAISCAGTLYIHFQGLLPPNGIFPGAKFTFHPSLAFSYLCSITARHSSIGVCQTLWHSAEGATYIWQGGHHVWHRPTFELLM